MAVYSWGLGKSGQLGLGTFENTYTPARIKLHGKVRDISCGGLFSALVTSTGEVYSFGEGKHGRLGIGAEHSHAIPTLIKKLEQAAKVCN
jgi:alpha-tubulin suppressor-like RCC1 family protein